MDKDTPDFWAMRAARELPLPGGHRDRGIFSIYLLNLLHLHPGQGTYQPAGTLHAYLEGTNIEVMASSDNVLRGGLTPKSVEVGELLRTVSYADGRPPVLTGREISPGVRAYETAAEEFVLDRIDLAANAPLRVGAEHGVECFITVEGSARLGCARRELTMDRGTAAMVPAGTPYDVRATAAGALLFRSRIPGA